MTIAAGYIRVSTEEQTEFSPEAQRKALLRYAGQHGLELPEEYLYIDAGVSGRRAETRPAFMAMIAAAKRKPPPFSVILIHKFDRFARNREDSIVYTALLRRQCGVQVVSITEHLEDDRMGLILEAMLEAMAEYYSVNLGDEVRKGMTEKARRGELQTAPPFGYTVRDNRLVPAPGEAETVREIYRRFLAGASLAGIARWSRHAGILSRRGNPLDSRAVRYILTNPVYLGILRWRPVRDLTEEVISVGGCHEALVEASEFRAAARLLQRRETEKRPRARPGEERKHWLSGLIRCGACGRGMTFVSPGYLRCGGYGKGKCAASQHVPAAALEAAILDRLRLDCAGTEDTVRMTPLSAGEEAGRSAVRALASLEQRLRRLREAYLCGAETVSEYRSERARLEALREELTAQTAEPEQDPEATETMEQAAARLERDGAGPEAMYRAASRILETCQWDRSKRKVTLIYRFPS